jgi:hypothetical protein
MITARHDRESELRILEALWQNHVQGVGRLRVLVIDRTAYIDGAVASYRQKEAVTELARWAAVSCIVVNRLRVVPAPPSGGQIKAQERGQPLA